MRIDFIKIKLIVLFLGSFLFKGYSQDININYIEANKTTSPYVHIYLQALDNNGAPFLSISDSSKIEIVEKRNDEARRVKVNSIHPLNQTNTKVFCYLLLDISGSMEGVKLSNAKNAIYKALNSSMPDSSLYLITFNDYISSTLLITKANYKRVIADVSASGGTKFFGALNKKLDEIKTKHGRKIIIVLTDGIDTRSAELKNQVFDKLANSGVSVYTIGLGDDADVGLLKNIPQVTTNKDDNFFFSPTPNQLSNIYFDIAEKVAGEFLIKVKPAFHVYSGIKREITAKINHRGNTYTSDFYYSFGSPTETVSFESKTSMQQKNNIDDSLRTGIYILLTLLLLFVLCIPMLKKRFFIFQYVIKYIKVKNGEYKNQQCLYCMRTFKNNDRVVTKCEHLIHLKCWKKGNKCPNYPQNCKEGYGTSNFQISFFKQTGIDKSLNWLWFGGLAGFLAWLVSDLLMIDNLLWYKSFLSNIEKSLTTFQQTADSYYVETINIVLIGGFLSFFLSFLNEMNKGFRFTSIFRILFITIIISILSWVIAMLECFVFIEFLNSDFFGRFVSWLLFGSLVGYFLTLYSGVRRYKGLLAGAISITVSFFIFYGLLSLFPSSTLIKMLAFLVFGALYGLLTSVIVDALENVWFSSPKNDISNIPLSYYLKGNRKVTVGNYKTNSIIRIKNDDTIANIHFFLELNNSEQIVFITPNNDNIVFLNNIQINRPLKLNNADIIMFGKTTLKYNEKR